MKITRTRRRKGAPFEESLIQDGDCIRWTASVSKDGYGKYTHPVTKKTVKAHRYAWELAHGPLDSSVPLDHVWARGCRYRDCVNVDHLEPVTVAENTRRAEPARRTHCPKGHEYSEENTYFRKNNNGLRQCRACHREETRRYRADRRAAQAA